VPTSMSEELRLIDARDAIREPNLHKCDRCHRRWADRIFDHFWVCAFCWHRLAAQAARG